MSLVLIIDDDSVVREAIKDILELIDVEVICAANGPDGIKAYKENRERVDGIIIDRRMPLLDGMAAIQELRKIQTDVPIIMSSGYADEDLMQSQNLNQEKPNAYLCKPYEIDDLIQLVEQLILKQ